MGQIANEKSVINRANIRKLSDTSANGLANYVPAAGEIILISLDNSMMSAGQGNFDGYIKGNGSTPAGQLTVMRVDGVSLTDIIIEKQESDLPDIALSDENGNILVEFKDGHMKTKNFDTKEAAESMIDRELTLEEEEFIDCGLLDRNGNAIVVFENGHIKTRNFNSANVDADPATYPFSYPGEKISVGRTNKMAVDLLFSTTHNVTRSIQGCACYGGYLFVAQDYMYSIAVYDIATKQLVNDIQLTSSSTYHCNNISFGRWKYASGDFSPCLYVSMENQGEHKCLVFQVTYSNGAFALTLVQTITYPTNSTYGTHYPNCFIDADNGKLFVIGYSTNSYQQADNTFLNILQYNLPLPTAGDVTLATPTATASVPSEYAAQGGFIEDGKLYQVYGIPSGSLEKTFLKVRSVGGEWPLLTSISLLTIGITEEPEAVCLSGENLLIVTVTGKVYKLTFKK